MNPTCRKAMGGVDVLFITVGIFMAALLVFCVIAGIKRGKRPATVIDRSHVSASTGFGIGYKGRPIVVFNPERWELIVRDDAGNVYAVGVSAESWADAKIGGRINDRLPEKP